MFFGLKNDLGLEQIDLEIGMCMWHRVMVCTLTSNELRPVRRGPLRQSYNPIAPAQMWWLDGAGGVAWLLEVVGG